MNATYPERVARDLARLARKQRKAEAERFRLRTNSPRPPRSRAFYEAFALERHDSGKLDGYALAVAALTPGVCALDVMQDAFKLADEYDRAEAIA